MRVEIPALGILPMVFALVAALEVDQLGVPVLFFSGHVVTALDQQDALTGFCQRMGQRSPASPTPDDDDVESILVLHPPSPVSRPLSAGAQTHNHAAGLLYSRRMKSL